MAVSGARPLPSPPARQQAGLLRRLLRQPHPVLDELRAAHGPMIGLGAGPLRMAVVGDPAAPTWRARRSARSPHPFPGTARARARTDRRALEAIIDDEIAERRAHPAGDPLDVMEVLVAEGTLSDAEIRHQVLTLVGAGHDTTAAALSWALWEATLAPGLWDALGSEADAVLGCPGAGAPAPDHTSLARLVVAERVMRETLRLHPAGALSPRQAVRDLELAGHRIPAGTMVLWSAHLIGRDPDAWPDPLRFDPDRMLDLDAEAKVLAEMAWVPFGRGARNCIGFVLAQMDITLILARLAQRLVVTPASTTVPDPVGMVVNRPRGGVPARIAARSPGRPGG